MPIRMPNVEEMAMMALRARVPPPIWTPREIEMLHAAREGLRSVPMSGSFSAVFEAIRRCIPFACGLIDTIRVSQPFEPVDALYRVPEVFITKVADIIEADPSPLVLARLPLGTMCRPSDFVSRSFWRQWIVPETLYPHYGIDFPSVLTLSSGPCGYDRDLTTIWFFNECNQGPLSDREIRMVELLHGDIWAAIERLRLPFMSLDSLQGQILREQNVGIVLLRMNGEIIECNRRAISLACRYATGTTGRHFRTPLSALVDRVRMMHSPLGFSAKYLHHVDRLTMLEIHVHSIARDPHSRAECVTLIMLREIPIHLRPIQPEQQSLIESLPPRRRQVAMFLVNSGLSFKEIAHELRLSEGTIRKHAENIYRTFGVRSRSELGAVFK